MDSSRRKKPNFKAGSSPLSCSCSSSCAPLTRKDLEAGTHLRVEPGQGRGVAPVRVGVEGVMRKGTVARVAAIRMTVVGAGITQMMMRMGMLKMRMCVSSARGSKAPRPPMSTQDKGALRRRIPPQVERPKLMELTLRGMPRLRGSNRVRSLIRLRPKRNVRVLSSRLKPRF